MSALSPFRLFREFFIFLDAFCQVIRCSKNLLTYHYLFCFKGPGQSAVTEDTKETKDRELSASGHHVSKIL